VLPLVRVPYTPSALPELVAFAEAHPVSPVTHPPLARFLGSLSPPDGVVDLHRGGRRVAVACVIDRTRNARDAALLELLGWDPLAPPEALLAAILPVAETVARRAERACVTLSLPRRLSAWAPPGWRTEEGLLVMDRPALPFEAPPLPPGAAWRDLDAAGIPEHHAVVTRTMANDPNAVVTPLEEFTAACLAQSPPVRVLVAEGREIGFVRVEREGDVGVVGLVGRVPERRASGIGPVLLAEALRLTRGAKVHRLAVSEQNAAAIALYRRWGFEAIEAWATWVLPLAPTR
jgi:GNAT superfamily N-acetyltransferase